MNSDEELIKKKVIPRFLGRLFFFSLFLSFIIDSYPDISVPRSLPMLCK